MSGSLEEALELAEAGWDQSLAELWEELRIPSISALPERGGDVRRNCEWLAQRFRAFGCEVSSHDVVEGGHPVLRADWQGAGPSAPTLTVYGHYDVQPVDPLEEWLTPPFEPAVRDGFVFARGCADNKNNHMAALQAARFSVQAGGPPLNLRFLIEDEEESGGQALPRYVREQADHLGTDWVLVWDGGFSPDGRPALVTGLRGMLYTELLATGAATDLHSGAFGGVAPNPLNTLARVVGELKGRDGRITIPGFYDRVRQPVAEELAGWDRSEGYGELLRAMIGAPALEGEADHSPVERTWSRPTLDVNGLIGGFTGAGSKTVIPAAAMAKVSMRLVPDQEPVEIMTSLRECLARLTTPGVRIEARQLAAAKPVLADARNPAAVALSRAFEGGFGQPAMPVRTGGSIPVALDFQEALGAPIVISGLSQPGSGAHGPNEHFSLAHYRRGIETLIRFYWGLAETAL